MSINMISKMSFECDDIQDFSKMLRASLELAFRAGRNTNDEYHNLQVMPANGKDLSYWMLESDIKNYSTLVCTIKKTYGDGDSLVKMLYEKDDTDDKPWPMLKWTKKSYDILHSKVMELVESTEHDKSAPSWMLDGDGSTGEGFGLVFRNSSPDIIYVYKTSVYYGK